MALIKCPECGKMISSFAKACPDCGYPLAPQAGAQPTPAAPVVSAGLEVPVVISRPNNLMGSVISGSIYIDDRMIGTLKNGGTLNTVASVGRHSVTAQTNVRIGSFVAPTATSENRDGAEFVVTDTTKRVLISVGLKMSFTNSSGSLSILDIRCE